ncbi:MAG: SDR family NAD(P)-dependent oxidoreductase [Myxococcota bacterium]|nr:SDR family NAD(P)-dependent oxidoreductase [Myxococcota bacterium]
MSNFSNSPIAVVGVSALFPGSVDKDGFWRDILSGRDLLTDVPATHWLIEDYYDADPKARDKTYARRGGFLPEVDFDPMAWGIPPSIVPATDTAQLLSLIVAQQVLEDACGSQFKQLPRDRISVILGVTSAQELLGSMVSRLQRPVWVKALREMGLPEVQVVEAAERIASHYVEWQESTFPGVLGNVVAGRIANRLDLGGTNCVTDAACASSFSALAMAVSELRLGQSDLVITGGADTMNDIFMYVCFSKTPALSPTGDCRPFSDKADGTMLGEGIGMVALKRLADAERDGDRIYAVVKGVGSSSDGRAKSVYAPVPEGQASALRRAYEQAGYSPDTVELVEAHGTGTHAGDAAEFEGLRQVFDATGREDRGWCALGSVKSQVGHTKAAAGAAGLFKVVMALHHKVLPPTIKVDRPAPSLAIERSPFYLNATPRPWLRSAHHPRRASVSAFGFGGSNFHLTLEEYAGPAPRPARVRPVGGELVLLSGQGAEAVAEQCRALARDADQEGMLAFLARSTQEAFDAGAPARLAIFVESPQMLGRKLTLAAEQLAHGKEFSLPGGIDFALGAPAGPVAFLFPGQGSQYLRMGADLAMGLEPAQRAWERAVAVPLGAPQRLDAVVFPKAAFEDAAREAQQETLTATEWAQPAIGAMSLALLEVLEELGVKPAALAGHSFGEATALCAAGALSKDDFLRVARKRGELMKEAARVPGAMTSVSGRREELEPLLAEWRSDVVVANHNSPNQLVLAGTVEAITEVEQRLGERGVAFSRLNVATAFHSPLVSPASIPFRKFLSGIEIGATGVDVLGTASAAPYPSSPDAIRDTLAQQLAAPVRFVDQIEALYARGSRVFVEVGPGRVLTGLVGHILKKRPHRAIPLDRRGGAGFETLGQGLALLSVSGVPVDYRRLWANYAPAQDPRTRKKPAMTLKINGSSYGKPYPPAAGASVLPKPNLLPPAPTASAAPRTTTPETAPMSASTPLPPPPASGVEPSPSFSLTPLPQVDSNLALAWVQAFQDSQRQTAEAHAAFQRAMTESHTAFLRSADQSLQGLAALLGRGAGLSSGLHGSPPLPSGQPAASASHPTVQPLAPGVPPRQQPLAVQPMPHPFAAQPTLQPLAMPQPMSQPPAAYAMQPAPSSAQPARAPAAVAPASVGAPAHATTSSGAPGLTSAELESLLVGVVAEKTGYPQEMIGLDMDLEADLGVDSIKRVQILAATLERAPGLPEVGANKMAALRTLREILSLLGAELSANPPARPASPASGGASADASATGSLTAAALESLLLGVVAEKTGYPKEMIGLDMDLEADLGVDSIKRVQILAATLERAPGLPEVGANKMAALRTLREILSLLGTELSGQAAPPPTVKVASISAPARAPSSQPVPPAKVESAGRLITERLEVTAVEAPALGLGTPGLFGSQPCLVTEDTEGVGAALVELLNAHGAQAKLTRRIPDDPAVRAVISLEGLSTVGGVADAVAANQAAFGVARGVARRFAAEGGTFITVQDTGGDFGLSGSARAWLAGPSALARTARAEWPRAVVRALDVERAGRPAPEVARAIFDELMGGGLEVEAGLKADGRRLTLATVRAALPEDLGIPLDSHSVVVASGGARGVTADCLIALARSAGCKFLLLGRTVLTEGEPPAETGAVLKGLLLAQARARGEAPTPAELGRRADEVEAGRAIRRTLSEIAAVGGEARYVSVDICDLAAVSAALTQARAWGPIRGVVHGAGVLADKRIEDKTDAQWARVFGTKVLGLQALLEATREDDLSLLLLFSSVAARWGNPGQCDYAMANEVLNKVAALEQQRRGPRCRVRSLGWGPWNGGMVDAALSERFASAGVPLLEVEEGSRRFLREVSVATSRPEVLLFASVEGPPGAPEPTEVVAEVHLDRSSHPFLDGHRVQGTAVVPVALCLEWFGRVAHALRPKLTLVSCHDVQVLHGIRLQGFDRGGDTLTVRARVTGEDRVEFEILGADGTRHYRARGSLAKSAARGEVAAPSVSGLSPWSGAIYDGGVLFHGVDFQVIESVKGISDTALTAQVGGLQGRAWPGTWRFDPGLLDGVLQLALLWTMHRLGGAGLPTSIESVQLHAAGPIQGSVRCILQGRSAARGRSVSDVSCVAADGTVVAELRGIEVHVLPQSPGRAA